MESEAEPQNTAELEDLIGDSDDTALLHSNPNKCQLNVRLCKKLLRSKCSIIIVVIIVFAWVALPIPIIVHFIPTPSVSLHLPLGHVD